MTRHEDCLFSFIFESWSLPLCSIWLGIFKHFFDKASVLGWVLQTVVLCSLIVNHRSESDFGWVKVFYVDISKILGAKSRWAQIDRRKRRGRRRGNLSCRFQELIEISWVFRWFSGGWLRRLLCCWWWNCRLCRWRCPQATSWSDEMRRLWGKRDNLIVVLW